MNAQASEDNPPTKNVSGSYYETDEFRNIIALNYCTYSLAKIASYNDRVVLDNEYNNIVNAINLKNIKDEKIITVIKQLMDTMTKFRLSEIEKNKLTQIYEKKSQQTILDMLASKATKSIDIKSAISTVSSLANPVTAIATAMTLAARAASFYEDYQQQMQTYKNSITDHQWNMTKEAIVEINELNKLVLDTYWRILQESAAPDEWRLTVAQLDALIRAGKEPDNATRYRMLVRLEKDSGYIPVYWYYRAQAAHAAAMDDPAQKASYAQDINKCVEFYEKYRGFLRRDELYASILMLDIANNAYADDIALKKLQHIIDNDPQDSSKRLFAALTCMERGLFDAAIEHLQANLDAKKLEVLTRRLMADALAAKQDQGKLHALAVKTLADGGASNQEALYQLGRLPDHKALEAFVPAITAIGVSVDKSFVGNAGLLLCLPQKWILASDDNMKSTLALAERVHTPQKISASKDGAFVFLHFEKVLDVKAALAMPQGQGIRLNLVTEHFPIQIHGRLVPMDHKEENTWFSDATGSAKAAMSSAMKSANEFFEEKSQSLGLNVQGKSKADKAQTGSQGSSAKNLIFVLDEIRTTETCLRLDAEKKLKACDSPGGSSGRK